MDKDDQDHKSGFNVVLDYVKEPSYDQFVFWVYFFVVVLFLGGCGVWETWCGFFEKMSPSLVSFNTIALSVAASACVDLVFSKDKRPLQALAVAVGAIVIFFHIVSLKNEDREWLSWPSGLAAFLVAHIAWVVVNAHNPNLQDVDPQDSAGGDPDSRLAGAGIDKGLKA